MLQTISRSRLILLSLLGTYLFVYPWAILLIALDRVPIWGTWMGGALLILQGTMMGLWLADNYGRRGTLAALLILLISCLVEYIGETTGFPFGVYEYTDVLTPKILGGVPLAIPFAWLLVVPAAIGVIDHLRRLRPRHVPTSWLGATMIALGAASLATLLDVTIEPVAVHINGYWTWDSPGGYYGVPMSNFAGWWITSLVLVVLVLWLRQPRKRGLTEHAQAQQPVDARSSKLVWLPPLLYLLNLTMFVLVNLAHNQLGAAAIGTLILGYLALDWAEPWLVQWVLGIDYSHERQPEG